MFMSAIDNGLSPAFHRKGNVPVTLAEPRRGVGITRGLLAVVVRSAIVAVPWIVRIIIRRVVSIIARLGRANPVIDVVNIGAAAKQKCKNDGADQRKGRYKMSTLF
jgi:hypothetical protein